MAERDNTKELLLHAAGHIFAEKGYEAASIREICNRAGVNLAAVSFHFGGKESLYIEAVKRACQDRMEEVPQFVGLTPSQPADGIREFIRHFLKHLMTAPSADWHRKLMLRELAQPSNACREFVHHVARPHFNMLTALLRQVLPTDFAERRIHMTAFSIISQCVNYAMNQPIVVGLVGEDEFATYSPDLLAQHISEFSLAALGLGPPLGVNVTVEENQT